MKKLILYYKKTTF